MKNLFLQFILLLTGLTLVAQNVEFEVTFGGMSMDEGCSAQQTTDGGYIIVGKTTSFGTGSYLVKTDANGIEQWATAISNTPGEMLPDVQQTADGGYIVSADNDTGPCILTKIDADGNEIWSSALSSIYMAGNFKTSVVQTPDGGYAVSGFDFGTTVNIFILKTDENGTEEWLKIYDFEYSFGMDLSVTSDGGFFVVGLTVPTLADICVLRTDADGNELWRNVFVDPGDGYGYSGKQTADGGFIVVGSNTVEGEGANVWLCKLDGDGNTIWEKYFGGVMYDEGWYVDQTTDGGYIVAGSTESFGTGIKDVYLIRTDANGNEMWTQTFGGPIEDVGKYVEETTDGGCVIAGYTNSYGAGDKDFYLIKLDDISVGINENYNSMPSLLTIYPNPFNDKTTLEFDNPDRKAYDFSITDLSGKTVKVMSNVRDNKIDIYRNGLPGGVYILELKGEKTFRDKLIIND
jgi:hypothetical protein